VRPTRLAVAGLATDLEPPTQWQRFPTNSMGKFVRTDSRDQFLISIRRTGSDYGVDYITICFPILKPDLKSAKWERDHKIWPDRAITERGKLDLRGGSQWIRVFVYERPQAHYGSAEHWCSVSFNPSRFVDPGGILLCDVTDLQVIVNKALKLIEEYIPLFPDMGPTDIRVKRLDVASNFYGVDSPTRYLRGLEPVRRPYARTKLLYSDQTLQVGSKSGVVRLYDKHAHTPDLALPGTLRFEVEARRGWLLKNEISSLADVTNETIAKLFFDRAKWFGVEREVMTTRSASEVITFSNLSPTLKNNLLRYVYLKLRGNDPGVDKKTEARYEAIFADFGICPYLEDVADRSITRLDLKSNREVKVA